MTGPPGGEADGFFNRTIAGQHAVSGSATSTNLLLGAPTTQIDAIDFYTNSIPGGTTLSARYSQDGSTWYDSASARSQYDTITSGAHTIDLSDLQWTTPNFYYQLLLVTTDTDLTPLIESTAINYTPNLYETSGVWKSNVTSYGDFNLQPTTIQALWTADADAPYPKFQLIGDNVSTLDSGARMELPAPGYYYQQGSIFDLKNNLEYTLSGMPFRKYWRVLADIGSGSDLTDAPSVDRFHLRSTSTVTPTAIFSLMTDSIVQTLTSLSGNIVPGQPGDTYDLGTAAQPWQQLYVSDQISTSGTVTTDKLRIAAPTIPGAADSTGTAGDVAWDSNYMYVCVATDTWKRSSITTW
jgi:hypothetical protein